MSQNLFPSQELRRAMQALAKLHITKPDTGRLGPVQPVEPSEVHEETIDYLNARVSDTFTHLFNPVVESMDLLTQDLQEMLSRSTDFAKLMLAVGWPPPLRLPVSYRRSIRSCCEREGSEKCAQLIEEILGKVYDNDLLEAMCAEWRTRGFLEKRMRVLDDAVQAHMDGLFFASIPTLLPAVEGLIADAFTHRGHLHGSQYKDYLTRLLTSADAMLYDQFIHAFIFEHLLAQFQHGTPRLSDLSRHAILHGADTEYGTKANSLKLIILVDHLQKAIDDFLDEQKRQQEPA